MKWRRDGPGAIHRLSYHYKRGAGYPETGFQPPLKPLSQSLL